jgi:Ca2+-binding RTX toxin-like protein
LKGDAGNDILVGGFGFDTLDGGAGLDTADYTFYNGNTGVNLANGRVAFEANPGQFETLTSIEIVFTGNGDDLLSGSAQSEGLAGTGGRDDIWGYGGNDVLDGGADLDHLYGGTGNDDLDGGTGSDTLWGNEGTDILLGGEDEDFLFGEAGPDRLTVGGADEDWFIYLKASDSRPGTGRDTIYDFNPAENDLIDLSDIDADRSNNPGNDRFKFIGGHKFSGNGGELRYKNGVLQMDIDGHGKIDMQINLANSPALHRDDFSL